VEENN
jgi:hypothetical protein